VCVRAGAVYYFNIGWAEDKDSRSTNIKFGHELHMLMTVESKVMTILTEYYQNLATMCCLTIH